jgi:phosphoribosylglycinamide formyltransferase 2
MCSQRLSEFELHARAILGLPVDVSLTMPGASAVIYGGVESKALQFVGVDKALQVPNSDLRLFGKPVSFIRRRMGVALASAKTVDEARVNAKKVATLVEPKGQ